MIIRIHQVFRGRRRRPAVLSILLSAAVLTATAQATDVGTVKVQDLPAYLKDKWKLNEPSMNENSRCAVTWDGSGEVDHMVMACSIYIRLAAEGERRALKGCEDERREKGVKNPCRLVLR